MTVEKEEESPRKEYKKPVLITYGSIEQLTNAIMGTTGADSGPGVNNKTA